MKAVIKKVVRQINKGGVTYDLLQNKDYIETRNIAIAPFPEKSETFTGKATIKIVTDYCEKNSDLLQKGFSLGAWFNSSNTKTYFDIVATIPLEKISKAIILGNKANQIAGFNLLSFTEIPLGGSGEFNSSVTPFEERLKEALVLMGGGKEKVDYADELDSILKKDKDSIDIIPTKTIPKKE